jgi:hypothetical protein
MEKSENPWSVPIAVEDIPEAGLHVDVEAPPAARAAVAALADLRVVEALSAAFDLTRKGAGVHVMGKVRGRVGQTCVVTLDPIENTIEEPVDLVFAPAGRAEAVGAEIKSLEPSDEPPEALIDGKLDLGALATEFLILGIDPYPRKPGAEFSPPPAGNTGEHPFAALAALKKSPEREF